MITLQESFLPRTAVPDGRLTPAEREVLALLRQGLSNKEIAAVRGRSVATIKNQVSVCLDKLGVDSRTRLMALFTT